MRTFLRRIVFLMVAILLLRTWCAQGLLVPCQVSGGSMALGLLGSHRDVVCAACGHRFACDADHQPVAAGAVCPNCGCTGNDLASQPELAGDRLLIDRTVFHFRPPRRWEVVACASPEDARRMIVKRVAGLPGESIQIRDGDVYVNGRIERKTLAEQHALMIPVHDAGLPSAHDPFSPSRWQAEGKTSRWQRTGGRFTCAPGPATASVDWLTYHHWRRRGSGTPQGSTQDGCEEPISDDCSYNQTLPRRVEDMHAVTDLLLSFRLVETTGKGSLIVRATDGRTEFQVCIDPAARRCKFLQNANLNPILMAEKELPPCSGGTICSGGTTVELSLFDQQLLLALDGRTVAILPMGQAEAVYAAFNADNPKDGKPRATSQPFAIGSQGLGIVLEDLRIFRDVYYTRPIGFQARWGLDAPYRLAADEYFVLGDNSPISADSRCWPAGPAVTVKLLMGKPLAVLFPARHVDLGGWSFQVPELARIRYIH